MNCLQPHTFKFSIIFFSVVKEGSSDYKKVRKRWFFKEPLTEWLFVEPKIVLQYHTSADFVPNVFCD